MNFDLSTTSSNEQESGKIAKHPQFCGPEVGDTMRTGQRVTSGHVITRRVSKHHKGDRRIRRKEVGWQSYRCRRIESYRNERLIFKVRNISKIRLVHISSMSSTDFNQRSLSMLIGAYECMKKRHKACRTWVS